MSTSEDKKITILGAGLVGSLLSIYLSRRGYEVTMYERRPDMRKENISAGKSINLALSDRGWLGLQGVGIEAAIRKVAIPMNGRMMHSVKGDLTYQQYGEEGQSIYATSRGLLNCVMMDEAEKKGVKIVFNHRCTRVDMENAIASFESPEGAKDVKSRLIFSADGAFSAGRLALQLGADRFDYSQNYLKHGYKELLIPAGPSDSFKMEKHALHIWTRGGYMLIALPNMDGSFTCTLFFPFEGEESFASIKTEEDCNAFFKKNFPDALELMPDLAKQFFSNPTGALVTVKCFPWTYKDKLCLIGDAAHAIVPFYGQGMNCGFEDCTVLESLLEKYNEDWSKVLPAYQAARKPNSDAIADLAIMNFVEMRDLVGSKEFLLRKKIEARIHEKHPEKWLPLYSQVTFSAIPYSEALANGLRQDGIMKKVMALPGIEAKWDSAEVEKMILDQLV
ncbi:MAG: FAD-dependent monooxygenase [Bacteroidetes bacterium]|nr:FAD-dependent monooxygenase [Bacteroidota bacterium]